MKLMVAIAFVALCGVCVSAFCCCEPNLPAVPSCCCQPCFNPKAALGRKYPLLFKLKTKIFKHCADDILQSSPCVGAITPAIAAQVLSPYPCCHGGFPPVLPAAPAPCSLCPPAPAPAPCSSCPAALPAAPLSPLTLQLLTALLQAPATCPEPACYPSC